MNAPLSAPQLAVALYREMRRVRLLDERLAELQRQGRIGFYGSCTGQEAVPVATGLALDARDWVFPALRESALLLVRGFPLESYVAQAFGNELDVLKGRQMPSHMSGRSANVVSWSSAIGTQLTHAVGAAWAARLRRDRSISVGFLGDGATSTADFHAALNFAAVFRVPCVFICQNNHFAISTPKERQTSATTFADRARAYGVVAESVDGNDALAVYAAVRSAAEHARSGQGPIFLECETYRVGPHSSSDDPSRYRTQAELLAWQARDPLARLAAELERDALLSPSARAELDGELARQISAAIAGVEGRPSPPRASLFDDVYAVLPWHLVEQRRSLLEER
ncbi:MAG TPA: thiamine pyrophosphate-dependent enzyme [Polyangiaceae bacterium]|jgi:pyruvate dehydrogenase E1 component alpha subunit/2-oxoisovalerate dehydrogenase E1 component alpha subunit